MPASPDFVIPPPPCANLPVEGKQGCFPIRRIICIGRNYGEHVREMGGDPKDQPPIFFAKPADAAVAPGHPVPYPSATSNLHHEIELVIALKGGGADVAAEKVAGLVYGYAVGVDLTRRDLQNAAKDKGQPWDSSKGFDCSAPMSAIRPAAKCGDLKGRITLSVNGAVKQNGKLSDMIWSVPEIIAQASKLWALAPGDLIFTGTPDGVGPLQRGDKVEGEVEGVGKLSFTVS